MTPQRRTALMSVVAAVVLIAIKLATGLATHSLGLLSEALHSGTDLVAALLTFFAVGVAGRPADPPWHPPAVRYSRALMSAIRAGVTDGRVRHVVYTSGAFVHGSTGEAIQDETAVPQPPAPITETDRIRCELRCGARYPPAAARHWIDAATR